MKGREEGCRTLLRPHCASLFGRGGVRNVGFTFGTRVTNLTVLVSNLGPCVSSGRLQAHISRISEGGRECLEGMKRIIQNCNPLSRTGS